MLDAFSETSNLVSQQTNATLAYVNVKHDLWLIVDEM